jgi:hypothetical protein
MAVAAEVGFRMRPLALSVLCLFAAMGLKAATYYVTAAGLGGEPDYEKRFQMWAADIDKTLRSTNPGAKVTTLSGADATRAKLEAALADVARQAAPEDAFVLMLIGHGAFDGEEYKFNLPGPDISAAQLASCLRGIRAERQLVVDMTSASGAAQQALAQKNRIVITATQSGNERNATLFPRFWIQALHDPGADTDKSGGVSALEAFRYASQKTAEFYETEKRIATEHAVLDDTAQGKGVRNPSPDNSEGRLAASFPLLPLASESATQANTPEKRKLLARKEQLETAIDRLKYQKAAIPEAEYKKQIGLLLLDLARTQAELDK